LLETSIIPSRPVISLFEQDIIGAGIVNTKRDALGGCVEETSCEGGSGNGVGNGESTRVPAGTVVICLFNK
jgi:hypothetical protein